MNKKLVLILIVINKIYATGNLYTQITNQFAATNFDYVTTTYLNSSIDILYNFENTNFVIGSSIGSIYGTTDTFYSSNGTNYKSNFSIPYGAILFGLEFKPNKNFANMTLIRFAKSFDGDSNCIAEGSGVCNPVNSNLNLMQIGFRNSTMYFFNKNIYMSFNAGLDINQFTFSPAFNINPINTTSSRTYHNPGPNLGFSIGYEF
jgi:hypothetical protein